MKITITLSLALLLVAALAFAQTSGKSTSTKSTTSKGSSKGTASTTAVPGYKTPKGGAKMTPSDVEYWDMKVGTGAEATKGKLVTVNYTGWLTTGKKFDSSVGAAPFQFRLGQGDVIKGWDEGVAGMKVGGSRKLKIPPSAGYGSQGAGGVIPPNATLIFDVELLKVQ
jgi:FKBP-type peptidyl-prolyl cis-trans isomerase FkpA